MEERALIFILCMICVSQAVDDCPKNESMWKERETKFRINCSTNKFYHCLRDENHEVEESCRERSWVQPGFCPEFNSVANEIDVFLCQEIMGKCPEATYWSNELYRYSACLKAVNAVQDSKHRENGTSSENVGKTNGGGDAILIIISSITSAIVVVIIIIVIIVIVHCFRRRRHTENQEDGRELKPLNTDESNVNVDTATSNMLQETHRDRDKESNGSSVLGKTISRELTPEDESNVNVDTATSNMLQETHRDRDKESNGSSVLGKTISRELTPEDESNVNVDTATSNMLQETHRDRDKESNGSSVLGKTISRELTPEDESNVNVDTATSNMLQETHRDRDKESNGSSVLGKTISRELTPEDVKTNPEEDKFGLHNANRTIIKPGEINSWIEQHLRKHRKIVVLIVHLQKNIQIVEDELRNKPPGFLAINSFDKWSMTSGREGYYVLLSCVMKEFSLAGNLDEHRHSLRKIASDIETLKLRAVIPIRSDNMEESGHTLHSYHLFQNLEQIFELENA